MGYLLAVCIFISKIGFCHPFAFLNSVASLKCSIVVFYGHWSCIPSTSPVCTCIMCLAFVVFWWGPKRWLSPAACQCSLQLDINWVSCRSWTLCRLLIDVAAFPGIPPSTYLPFPYLNNPCSSFCMCPLMASLGKSSQALLGCPSSVCEHPDRPQS